MSEFRGTPGPWEAHGGVVYDVNGLAIADLLSELTVFKSAGIVDANARLIAAAPELLETLIGVFQDEARSYNDNPDEWKAYAGPRSLAAITKALGNE